jgi:uncharacterized protein
MNEGGLNDGEKKCLLKLARETIQTAVNKNPLSKLDLENLPPRLREPGATFVTLTKAGELRGCIGVLEAYQPLAEDVREHALAAAFDDFRFPPVQPDELDGLLIEISYLTPLRSLEYATPLELLQKLRPGIDGVVIKDGPRRATFLPQVWDSLPDPASFLLDHLCQKMGAPKSLWRVKNLTVLTYQVEEFQENN